MSVKVVANYYIKRTRKLMRNFEERIEILVDLLRRKF